MTNVERRRLHRIAVEESAHRELNRRQQVKRFTTVATLGAGVIGMVTVGVGPVHAASPPTITTSTTIETFADDLILELCGVTTMTTLTERVAIHDYPDGSSRLHVQREYVSEDLRIPIERAAATSFISADGSRRVTGTPIHLIGSRGTIVLDAGNIMFGSDGELVDTRGPHPFVLSDDIAQYYCAGV
jgi:hypothetical protein